MINRLEEEKLILKNKLKTVEPNTNTHNLLTEKIKVIDKQIQTIEKQISSKINKSKYLYNLDIYDILFNVDLRKVILDEIINLNENYIIEKHNSVFKIIQNEKIHFINTKTIELNKNIYLISKKFLYGYFKMEELTDKEIKFNRFKKNQTISFFSEKIKKQIILKLKIGW
jgi:hypothetical protein